MSAAHCGAVHLIVLGRSDVNRALNVVLIAVVRAREKEIASVECEEASFGVRFVPILAIRLDDVRFCALQHTWKQQNYRKIRNNLLFCLFQVSRRFIGGRLYLPVIT